MTYSANPFPGDPDRTQIWEMLVPRDIAAFVSADWGMVAEDFIEDFDAGDEPLAPDVPAEEDAGPVLGDLVLVTDCLLRFTEKAQVQGSAHIKEEIDRVRAEIVRLQRQGKLDKVAELQYGKLPQLEAQLKQAEKAGGGDVIPSFGGFAADNGGTESGGVVTKDLTLSAAGAVEGVVTNSKGAPISGARVRTRSARFATGVAGPATIADAWPPETARIVSAPPNTASTIAQNGAIAL